MLFIRGGAVGDFILTLPAIQLTRETLPDLEIEIMGYESIISLALAAGVADRIRSIEHATLAPFFAPGASLDQEMCDYFKSFDVVVSYLYDPDAIFSGNLERAGVETLIMGPYRISEDVPYLPAVTQLAAPLERLALFLEQEYLEVSYGAGNNKWRNQSTPLVAIHPGSGSPRKNWSFEGWCEIASRIRESRPALKLLVVSGEAEEETIWHFEAMLRRQQLDHETVRGKTLPEVGRILSEVDLFLGHDSGISHLAASTGIPGFLLFGPTIPEIWAPRHPGFRFLKAPGGQMGNITPDLLWNDLQFRERLKVSLGS